MFHSLHDFRRDSVRAVYDGMEVIREHYPGDHREHRLLLCSSHSAKEQAGMLIQYRLPMVGDGGDETALTRRIMSEEF
jgi:hypothetical protein